MASNDPNEIVGPAGVGPDQFLRAEQTLPYTIHFENLATATAPAQEVVITQQLDSDLDWTTFAFGDFGLGDQVIRVPKGRNYYTTRIDLTATLGFFVDVEATLSLQTGSIRWHFISIDPATGDIISDPLAGFLPPNVNPGEGEGFVTYSVRSKSGLPTGTRIDALATIVFDVNEPIDTQPIYNTIDAGEPASRVDPLSASTPTREFLVS